MTNSDIQGWKILWGVWKGGRVGVQFNVLYDVGGRFLAKPVGVVAGPEKTLFPFAEECEADWCDLSQGFTDDAMAQLMEIAGFSAHQLLQIAFLAQKKEG